MARIVSSKLPFPGVTIAVLLLLIKRNSILGRASASFTIKSLIFDPSVCVVFRNFLRAGVLKNRSSTVIVVPSAHPASVISGLFPPRMSMRVPRSAFGSRVRSENRDTEAIVGNASPRNPSVPIMLKSWASRILLVACRKIAS